MTAAEYARTHGVPLTVAHKILRGEPVKLRRHTAACARCGWPFLRWHLRSIFCAACIQAVIAARSRAALAIRKAIAKGEMRPAKECSCRDCGRKAREYDHRDYAEPLKVDPVCRSCNIKRGPAKWEA